MVLTVGRDYSAVAWSSRLPGCSPPVATDTPSAGALYSVGEAIRRVCCSGLRGLVAYSALKRGPYPLEYYQLGERNVTDVGDEGL